MTSPGLTARERRLLESFIADVCRLARIAQRQVEADPFVALEHTIGMCLDKRPDLQELRRIWREKRARARNPRNVTPLRKRRA